MLDTRVRLDMANVLNLRSGTRRSGKYATLNVERARVGSLNRTTRSEPLVRDVKDVTEAAAIAEANDGSGVEKCSSVEVQAEVQDKQQKKQQKGKPVEESNNHRSRQRDQTADKMQSATASARQTA